MMKYGGNNEDHANGVSTESIKFEEIASGIDYLIFLNRELASNVKPETVKNYEVFNNDSGAKPIVKYYVHEESRPKFVKFWNKLDYDEGHEFDEGKDVSFL